MHKFPLTLAALFVLTGCPGPAPVDCRVGADCASGVCRGDGTCGEATIDAGADGGATDAGADAGTPSPDGGTTVDAGFDAGQPMGCLPNNDGRIDRSEVFFQPGLRATYRTSGAATFDTRGTDGGHWDFTGALPQDAARLVSTLPITGQWFETDFPDGGYASELGQGTALLGIFSATADALYLQGVASTADGLQSTRLHYDPWVKVLQFPLQSGQMWETNANVTGRYNGLVVGLALPVQSERYQMNVDRAGTAVTPFSAFPVLRVRTVMTRSLNFVPSIVIRSFNWNTECFGTVASVTSNNNEASTEFTSATEVRRLSP